MKYEVVTLEEKPVVGIISKISNEEPDMKLWSEFYKNHYANIKSKPNQKVYGIYHTFFKLKIA